MTPSKPSSCNTSGTSYRLPASAALTTASGGTSHSREIFCFSESLTGRSLRHTMTSGWMPRARSSVTECWVGLVFCSPAGPMNGTSVTWTKATLLRPMSSRNCRIASRKGRISMSPTVPPISVMTTSTSSPASRLMRRLISSVMCGMTWTVLPR